MFEDREFINELGAFLTALAARGNDYTDETVDAFMEEMPKYFDEKEMELLNHAIEVGQQTYQNFEAIRRNLK